MKTKKLSAKRTTLIDGEERNRLHPKTFEIPSLKERMNLEVGQTVKIGVETPGHGGERFWVRVSKVTEAGKYQAKVEQADMLGTANHGVKHKSLIEFEAKHVLATDG